MMKPQHASPLLLTILMSETAFARCVKDVMWTADTPEDVKTLLQEVQRQDRALFDGFVGRAEGEDGSYVQRTFAGTYGDLTIHNQFEWREQSEFERVEDAVERAWWSYSVPRKDFTCE